MGEDERSDLAALQASWRSEPGRMDLACILYDALMQSGRNSEAGEVMRAMIARSPQDINARYRLGASLATAGHGAEAAQHFRAATDAPIAQADDWLYRSLSLAWLGRSDEAATDARTFLELRPGNVHGAYHLAALLIAAKRMGEAADVVRAVIEQAGAAIEDLAPLVLTLRLHGVAESESWLARIAERVGGDPGTLVRIARLAHAHQAPHAAVALAARALTASRLPEVRVYHDLLLPHMQTSTEETRWWLERYRRNVEALASSGIRLPEPLQVFEDMPPEVLLFFTGENTKALYAASARAWESLTPTLSWSAPHCSGWRNRPLERRLRVGFLTTNRYPLLWGLAQELDRERFETVHLYETVPGVAGADRWAGAVDRQVALPREDLRTARELVAGEQLDVILCTPFRPLLYFLMHARLAPVQCVLAEPAFSDGVAALDHYVSWEPAEPRRLDEHYTAAVALMQRPPYWIERDFCVPDAVQREDFALPQARRWYVCPATPFKFHPACCRMLARLLAADPGGILVLLHSEFPQMQLVERQFRAALGGAAERMHVLPTLEKGRCHALLRLADAVLDTWPIGGMSSSYTALHVAAPTVTLPVEVPYGRWMAALYEWIGVTDLIAANEDEYVRLAVRLAADPAWRRDLACRITERSGILIEDRLAVRELERFLLAAAGAAHRGEPPRTWVHGRFVAAGGL